MTDRRVVPVSRATSATPVKAVATDDAANASTLAATTQTLAASPPVDADRVARIRKAIASGTFPILPATIADRLIAFKLDWKSNDPA